MGLPMVLYGSLFDLVMKVRWAIYTMNGLINKMVHVQICFCEGGMICYCAFYNGLQNTIIRRLNICFAAGGCHVLIRYCSCLWRL